MSTVINLSGLTVAAPKGKAKEEKPHLADPTGELMPLVAQCIDNKKVIDAREGALTVAKATLGKAAFSHACKLYAGRDTKIEDTFQIGTAAGKALISLQNKYKLPANLDAVKSALGEHAGDVLRESFTISIDADALPSFVQQSFVDELVKLAQSLDAMLGTPEGQAGAVIQAITVKPTKTVVTSFHERRYAMFTPEQNAELHKLMPCVIAVKLDY